MEIFIKYTTSEKHVNSFVSHCIRPEVNNYICRQPNQRLSEDYSSPSHSRSTQKTSSSFSACSHSWISIVADMVLVLYLSLRSWMASNVAGFRWFCLSVLVIQLLDNTCSEATAEP